ncbi:hypothetical protein [Nonomuraea cavernae]|uniref:hypothetical protein n=1 Tax=Nonomuraea cavernae TaxID=2045107 RepID=UPI003405FFC1
MRLVLVAATAMVGALLLGACTTSEPSADELEQDMAQLRRYGYVVANAFRATNPEYAVHGGNVPALRSFGELAIEMDVRPSWRVDPFVNDYATVAIRQNSDTGQNHFSHPADRTPMDKSVAIHGSAPMPGEAFALRSAVRRMGSPLNGTSSKREIDRILSGAGRTKGVTALVELAKPMTAEQIRNKGYITFTNALFAPATDRATVYWDSRITMFCQGCSGNSHALTEEFRSWVSTLSPDDDSTLRQFGLSYDRLIESSNTGKIYGYIEAESNPILLRELLKKSHVKTMYVIGVTKNCELDEDGRTCHPFLWPKSTQLNGLSYSKLDNE